MSDDPFEAELEALRPRRPSPELSRQVGERLATRSRRRWWVSLLIAPAVMIVALLLLRRSEGLRVQPSPPPPVAIEEFDPPPTLQAYRRALSRSPEDLDALLARHALGASTPAPVFAFRPSDFNSTNTFGEP